MVADVLDLARYLVNNSVENMLSDAINDVHEELEELNTSQLESFKDSKGKFLADIGGEYSPETQFEKGLRAREVNLLDTRDYYDSFEYKGLPSGDMGVDSDPMKGNDNLEDRWGDDLEGLNEENTEKANELIETAVWKKAEKSL